MARTSDLGVYLESGDRHSTYYFRVPDVWAGLAQADLDGRVMHIMQKIYSGFNEHFRQVEPNDMSYLAPLAVSSMSLRTSKSKPNPG